MNNERNNCTKESPMPKDAPGRWIHHNTEEVGDQEDSHGWGGDIVTMRCLNCNHTWRMELPQ
jgi:hypothetical protein